MVAGFVTFFTMIGHCIICDKNRACICIHDVEDSSKNVFICRDCIERIIGTYQWLKKMEE